MHPSAVTIISLENLPLSLLKSIRSHDNPFSSDRLRNQCFFGIGAGAKRISPNNNIGGFVEVLKIFSLAKWFFGDEEVEGEGLAVGDFSEIDAKVVDLVVGEASLNRTCYHYR